MSHTLKEAIQNRDFIKAVEWLKKEQKYRFNNNYYSKNDGENL